MATSPTKPAGLAEPGTELWQQLTAAYVFTDADLVLLEEACRTRDLLARIEAELTSQPLTVPAPGGSIKAHPLLPELSKHRGILSRLLRQLDVPDLETEEAFEEISRSASTKARRAARARWGTR